MTNTLGSSLKKPKIGRVELAKRRAAPLSPKPTWCASIDGAETALLNVFAMVLGGAKAATNPEGEDRALCARHRRCDVFGLLAEKRMVNP